MKLQVTIISAILAIGYCIEDVSKLNLTGDFNSQVDQIFHSIRLGKNEMNFTQLYNDLQQSLGTVWSGLDIVPFGSVVTGLGFKTSDVDILAVIPNVTMARVGQIAKIVLRLIQRRPDVFSEVELVSDKRIPIVSFHHIPTGRKCDVTFSGTSSVRNSLLFEYLFNIDQRVLNMAVLIKYWSKIHNLTGTNLLSSYSLSLQMIFFLQQKHILPAIIDLQRNATRIIDDDWNTGFNRIEYRTNNNETLYQLLGGFFEYFSVFEYDRFVMSLYLGRPLNRKVFESLDTLPDEFVLYKENIAKGITPPYPLEGLISVQDPFDHNRNTADFTPHVTRRVISHYKYAARKFEENDNSFLRSILTKDSPRAND